MACAAQIDPETKLETETNTAAEPRLQQEAQRHAQATVAHALETNNQHFCEARDKLDHWADDMVKASEQALKSTKDLIKAAQREARQAPSLAEQQASQERIAQLERKQRKQRQEIFDVEDDIHRQRDQLITQLTQRMAQKVQTEHLFTLRWIVQ
jgi:organic radical activating enzyme